MSDEAPQAPSRDPGEPEQTAVSGEEHRVGGGDDRAADGDHGRAADGGGTAPRAGAAPRRLPSGLFQRLRTARRALTVIRGYAFIGTLLAAGLFAASYVLYDTELARWICRLGAMGALLSAVVGLNVMDRLVRGRSLPASAVALGLAFIAVALLGVGVSAVRYELGAAWSPLTAATYVVVGVRILLRFRSAPKEASL